MMHGTLAVHRKSILELPTIKFSWGLDQLVRATEETSEDTEPALP